MNQNDYSALDAEILKLINAGCNTFTAMRVNSNLIALSQPFVTERTEDWRIIDRRLQALRKASKIRYRKSEQTWEIHVQTSTPED